MGLFGEFGLWWNGLAHGFGALGFLLLIDQITAACSLDSSDKAGKSSADGTAADGALGQIVRAALVAFSGRSSSLSYPSL